MGCRTSHHCWLQREFPRRKARLSERGEQMPPMRRGEIGWCWSETVSSMSERGTMEDKRTAGATQRKGLRQRRSAIMREGLCF
jgi:hypothetical protein